MSSKPAKPAKLRSEMFSGDARLESCLHQDSAHVTPGTTGPFVSKIHTALLVTAELHVDSGELKSQTYGPTTAAAVLAYKTQRKIINRAYQSQPDNIVGKMTIAALDAEVFQAEQRRLVPLPPRQSFT